MTRYKNVKTEFLFTKTVWEKKNKKQGQQEKLD